MDLKEKESVVYLEKYIEDTLECVIGEPCIILFNGKRVKVPSGKSVWASKGHAKNAIHNALNTYSLRSSLSDILEDEDYGAGERMYKKGIEELINNGTIEILELTWI